MLRRCLLLLLIEICGSIETSIVWCLSRFENWLLINSRWQSWSYLALKAVSDARLNQIACLLILLLWLLVQFWLHEPISCILLGLEILLLLFPCGVLLRQVVSMASLLFDRLMILIRKVDWRELALRLLNCYSKPVIASRSGPIVSQSGETTDEARVSLSIIDKLWILDLFPHHNSFVFKRDHVFFPRFHKFFEALDLLSHLTLLLAFELKCIIHVGQLWFLPANLSLQFCLYLLILTPDCRGLVLYLFKVALDAL